MGHAAEKHYDIVESMPVLPLYVTGVGPVSVRNGLVYLSLTSEQCRVDGNGLEDILVARLVMPVDFMQTITKSITAQVMSVMEVNALSMS